MSDQRKLRPFSSRHSRTHCIDDALTILSLSLEEQQLQFVLVRCNNPWITKRDISPEKERGDVTNNHLARGVVERQVTD
jgi:hypothetical protein